MNPIKIALTGGPCGGKTTSIQDIEAEFTEKGYRVIIVPEAATILINMGIKPFGNFAIDIIEFQRYVINLQLKLEDLADHLARETKEKTIIICDRGIPDDRAYVTEDEYLMLLKEFGKRELEVMENYQLTLHLRTAALGKEEFYTLANNKARTETIEEAREKDQKALEAWLGHESLRIIGNETNFEEKKSRVIREIYEKIGKPYPTQRQYKYLIDRIDLDHLNHTKLVKLEIEQYIIDHEEKQEIIYRKTTKDEDVKYTAITKIDTDIHNERIIKKRKISEEEYYDSISTDSIPIIKNRYCFEYQDQYFRLDIFDDGLKILELEETNKTKKRVIPDFIEIIEEITDNVEYRNSSLYQKKNQRKTYCLS